MFRAMGVMLLALATVVGAAEAGAAEKAKPDSSSAFTLGVVQRELRSGLSQAEVVERLGSPNILTRDGAGREAWVYDKVSSDIEASNAGVGIGGLGAGAGSTFAGLIGISGGKSKATVRSSQRTLTVVVRFSAAGTVESFTWHNSRF